MDDFQLEVDTPVLVEAPPLEISVGFIPEIPFAADWSLYAVQGGQFLFRWKEEKNKVGSKFLTIDDVRAALTQEERDTGWLPGGILRFGSGQNGDWFVYGIPPQRFTITLVQKTSVERSSIPLPYLVFMGSGLRYHIWALKEKEFSPNAIVYQPPLPNVYADGRICWGTNSPEQAGISYAEMAFHLFVRSPFNDHLIQNKSRRHPDDIRPQLRRLAEKGAKHYPIGDLRPTDSNKLTVAKAVERLIQGS